MEAAQPRSRQYTLKHLTASGRPEMENATLAS